MHPLLQLRLRSLAPAAALFRAPVTGPLHALVAEHIVRGRVVFPGAAYLEMARAASGKHALARAGARGTSLGEVGISLSEIFF